MSTLLPARNCCLSVGDKPRYLLPTHVVDIVASTWTPNASAFSFFYLLSRGAAMVSNTWLDDQATEKEKNVGEIKLTPTLTELYKEGDGKK